MADLEFPLSSSPGLLPGEADGRLINTLAEKTGARSVLRRCAGLASIGTSSPASGARGMFVHGSAVYVAFADVVARFSDAGVYDAPAPGAPSRALPGTDQVTFARDLRQPLPNLLACRSSGGAYVINPTTGAVTAHPDADLPKTVNSVTSLSAFTIYSDPATGKIFASEVNSTDQSALSYASAEASPDNLVRVIRSQNMILAMGDETVEPWVLAGTSPFPLIRQNAVMDTGLYAFGAIAGPQPGWDHQVLWVAHDGTVVQLEGYRTTRVSTPAVERFIAASSRASLLAQVYVDQGQPVWALSSDQGTWFYYLGPGSWVERQTAGGAWRAGHTAWVNKQWLATDRSGGGLLRISRSTLTDVGAALPATIQSVPVKGFPDRSVIPAVHLDFTRGGGGNVEFRFSKDGGRSWSDWESFSLGSTGEDDGPVIVNRLGRATTHGLTVEVRVSDAVNFSFMGGSVPDAELNPARGGSAG